MILPTRYILNAGSALTVALLVLAACQQPSPPGLEPLEQPSNLQAAEPRVSGKIPIDRGRQRAFEERGVATAPVVGPSRPAGTTGQVGDVTLNFVDTDIREIVRTILGTTLKVNYTIDPNVHGTGSIDTGTPLTREALLPTLETLLNQNGATLVGLARAFDIDILAGQSFALFPIGDSDAAKRASELERVLQAQGDGALGGIVRVIAMDRVNAVLVVSSQSRYIDAARRFFRLTNQVEDATARTWHVYYVQNGQSTDLENLLQRAFTPAHVTTQPTQPGVTAPGAEQLTLSPGGAPGGGPSGFGGAAGGA